jgi:hypothetical protein
LALKPSTKTHTSLHAIPTGLQRARRRQIFENHPSSPDLTFEGARTVSFTLGEFAKHQRDTTILPMLSHRIWFSEEPGPSISNADSLPNINEILRFCRYSLTKSDSGVDLDHQSQIATTHYAPTRYYDVVDDLSLGCTTKVVESPREKVKSAENITKTRRRTFGL